MSDMYRMLVSLVLAILVVSCGAPDATRPPTATAIAPAASPVASATPEPLPPISIARFPQQANFRGFNVYTELPVYDPNSTEGWQVDLRSSNLKDLDLSQSTKDLLFADFDSKTQWPSSDKMPVDFDWQKILEMNKDPGLGIRTLHDQGIDGMGVGVAIIDQTLLVDHIEYAGRMRLYEEPEKRDRGREASMHGPAVASIAVGRTVGVAPNADLYYLASPICFENNDFECLARSVRRVIEINQTLPARHKIRVLAIARGWASVEFGYDDIMTAVKEATDAGIFVISSSLSQTHSLHFHGLGRDSLSNPNQTESYMPGLWWQDYFFENGLPAQTLMVPMDSRTTASPTGKEDYVFYRQGGWSWAIPYLAGMYTLAVQVKPDITPEEFWDTALNTGRTIHIGHNGKEYEFGVILDPQALIEAIKSK